MLDVAAPRRRRPRRALQRLRQHRRRQADGARAARSALRRPRLGQHRLPRAVARPVVLLVDGDELRQPRAGARAVRVADAAGRLARRRRCSARSRSSRRTRCTPSAGVVDHAGAGARHHRRLLPHRHRRPHRPLRQLHRAADRRAARAVRRQQRAVLHQRDRHADQRRRRDRQLPRSRSTPPATCGCAPATTTRGRRSSASIATPPQLAGFESVLFDRIERRRIECGQPQDSVRLGGDWRRSRLGRQRRPGALRRVLQLHAEPGRRSGVRRRSG